MTASQHAFRGLAPGVSIAIGLALAAQLAARGLQTGLAGTQPLLVSPALLGLLFGILGQPFIARMPSGRDGVQWIAATALRAGIALVGLRLTLGGFSSVASIALPVIVSCIVAALLVSRAVGGVLGLSQPLQQLLAVGSAVCGCTAIMATAPVVRARADESAAALACTVLLGSCSALLYPWLAASVFDGETRAVGIFLGSAIHDTSQVIAAALIYAQQFGSPDVVGIASATKLLRNLAMIVLIPFMAWQSGRHSAAAGEHRSKLRLAEFLPLFVIVFVAFVLVRALGDHSLNVVPSTRDAWAQLLAVAQRASELLLTCGITALGLSVSASQIRSVGSRAVVAAALIAGSTALCSLGLTYTFFMLFR